MTGARQPAEERCERCDGIAAPRLHDYETTSKILGGIVSARWLEDHKDELHHTRFGRAVGFTDEDITLNLAEHAFDSTGRRKSR
ncbi:MAG TPA: hypothetical protein VFA06_03110 [Actinocrinis sp.]|uniref:hypothetical protein n=1 Tax=Actinocrinis sp. TaxID=1920516 RepID=UPI002D319054|nr:hypothetical protein [Actinocrinis sp.]HZU54838.1 hypothetical protein [Actinocrinis sp.]